MLLTTCPSCGGGLIYPTMVWPLSGDEGVADRRCPECEHRDSVRASLRVLRFWQLRQDVEYEWLRHLVADEQPRHPITSH
jgi:hypothetical protein